MKRPLTILLLIVCFANAGCATMPTEKSMSAYLMVYFKEYDHHLFMALSGDGYTFTDVNGGKPVMRGDTIALQKGIRDPFIYRGPDNMFYLTMTDLHIYAREEGLRETQWEREGYGWGENRAIVLMRSPDLINWTRANLRFDTAFPGYENIGCVWAPQVIWDPEERKMMLYFTMRFGNGRNQLYYAYTDDDFTRLVTPPALLFDYPGTAPYIDADITRVDNRYHMFYKVDDSAKGIKQAVSDKLNEGYIYDPRLCDPGNAPVEAPTVWKRIGEEKWVLMYDAYAQPNNMGFSETTDFENFTDIGRFNEGVMKTTNFTAPKHGAVIHLTAAEAEKLARHWGTDMTF